MNVTETILESAQRIADRHSRFFEKKGPGAGNRDANLYMANLRTAVEEATGKDYSEQRICGNSKLAVDFFIPDESTIIEVALSLRNPNTEFERDILKALMAKEEGHPVRRLVLIAKPGGERKLRQASSQAMISWAKDKHELEIEAHDLQPTSAEQMNAGVANVT